MRKGASKDFSPGKSKTKHIIILILVVAVLTLLIYQPSDDVLLSGNPTCIESGIGCECNDGIDNDFDGVFDHPFAGTGGVPDIVCLTGGSPTYDDECPNGEVIFRLSDKHNAHGGVENPISQPAGNFPYSICADTLGIRLTDAGSNCACLNSEMTYPNCDALGDNRIIRLSTGEHDGHAEKTTASAYLETGVDVCFNALDCVYTTGACEEEHPICLASIKSADPAGSPDSNMHLAICDDPLYPEKICCSDTQPLEIFSEGDLDPSTEGRQIARLTTHTFHADPEKLPTNIVSYKWILKAQLPVTIAYGDGPTVEDTTFTFNQPVGTTFEWAKLELTKTDGSVISWKTELIEIIAESFCGDGFIQLPEQCDEGAANSNTGSCKEDCTIPQCGDGFIYPPTEECDDGNQNNNDDCTILCKAPVCGDSFVWEGNEVCDDGNTNSCDGCDATCTREDNICGDDLVECGEVCEGSETTSCTTTGGYQGNMACDANACIWTGTCVSTESCGDSVLNGNEVCDDGPNDVACTPSVNGCTPDCTRLEGVCGDNIQECNEVCDDGNLNGQPLNCNLNCDGITPAICGNGIAEEGEMCDGDDLSGMRCEDIGVATPPPFTGGILGCNPASNRNECTFNTNGCTICGDGICEAPYESGGCYGNCQADCGEPTGPCTCFAADTEILTPESSSKIQNIKVGDIVLSFNEKTKKLEPSEVIQTFEHITNSYLIINNKLKVTPEHPMFVNEKWVEIGSAKIGDKIKKTDGEETIYSIKKIDESIPVYNLEVKNNHNYYAENMLAHNKPPITANDSKVLIKPGDGSVIGEGIVSSENKGYTTENLLDKVLGLFR